MEIKNIALNYQTVKPNIKMNKVIIKAARDYQEIDRQIKELEARKAPLKKQLLDYAQEHKSDFDQALQLKFPNGTYITQRVKDCLEGSKEDKDKLLKITGSAYEKRQLNEATLIGEALGNARLRKQITKLGLKIVQKEILAVYAS